METITKLNLENKIENIMNTNDTFEFDYVSYNSEDTILLGKTIAKHLKVSNIIVLNGELGAGKTVFMNGIAKYFNITNQVSSPTFTIVNEYMTDNNLNIYHFDVYRLKDSEDFIDSVGTDYFNNGISIIEWGNIIKEILPKHTIYLDISKDTIDEDKRYIKVWRK